MYVRDLPIPTIYQEAIEASFMAVQRRKDIEMDSSKRTKYKLKSAAVQDRIFDRRLYLPNSCLNKDKSNIMF